MQTRAKIFDDLAKVAGGAVEVTDENWGRVHRDYIVCLQLGTLMLTASSAESTAVRITTIMEKLTKNSKKNMI